MTTEIICNTKDIHDFIKNFRFGKSKENKYDYYPFERKFINHIMTFRFTITLKARDSHTTSLLAMYTAWRILNGNDVVYISRRQEMNFIFCQMVQDILIRSGNNQFRFSKREIHNINGNGKLYTRTASPDSLRGIRPDDIIVDEAAYIDNLNSFLGAGMTSLKTGGKCILVSSPNDENDFEKIWRDALRGDDNWQPFLIRYLDNPKHTIESLNKLKEIYDEDSLKREVYCEFVTNKKKPKKNKTNLIQFRVNDDLYHEVCQKLIDEDISVSQFMRNLLTEHLNK
jgi:hypothetical protein